MKKLLLFVLMVPVITYRLIHTMLFVLFTMKTNFYPCIPLFPHQKDTPGYAIANLTTVPVFTWSRYVNDFGGSGGEKGKPQQVSKRWHTHNQRPLLCFWI